MKNGGQARIAIRDSMLKVWNISEEELKQVAEVNTPYLKGANLRSIEEVIVELVNGEIPWQEKPEYPTERSGLFVLTNDTGTNGASCIAYPGMTEKIASVVGDEYYILPSSVNEVLILKKMEEGMDVESMERLVQEVNRTQVKKEEWLGEHPYRYDKTLGVILPVYANERKNEQEVMRYEARRR